MLSVGYCHLGHIKLKRLEIYNAMKEEEGFDLNELARQCDVNCIVQAMKVVVANIFIPLKKMSFEGEGVHLAIPNYPSIAFRALPELYDYYESLESMSSSIGCNIVFKWLSAAQIMSVLSALLLERTAILHSANHKLCTHAVYLKLMQHVLPVPVQTSGLALPPCAAY